MRAAFSPFQKHIPAASHCMLGAAHAPSAFTGSVHKKPLRPSHQHGRADGRWSERSRGGESLARLLPRANENRSIPLSPQTPRPAPALIKGLQIRPRTQRGTRTSRSWVPPDGSWNEGRKGGKPLARPLPRDIENRFVLFSPQTPRPAPAPKGQRIQPRAQRGTSKPWVTAPSNPEANPAPPSHAALTSSVLPSLRHRRLRISPNSSPRLNRPSPPDINPSPIPLPINSPAKETTTSLPLTHPPLTSEQTKVRPLRSPFPCSLIPLQRSCASFSSSPL